MDIGDTDTIEEMVAALVAAINVVIRDDDQDVQGIELAHVLEELYSRHDGADTSVTLTQPMVGRAADALVQYTHDTYGLFAPLRAGELSLSRIGDAMINIAIADMGMRETPLEFIRMAVIQKRLVDMVVVFAIACLDPAVQCPHETASAEPVSEEADEAAGWMVQAGIILADRELLQIYLAAIWDYEHLPGFEAVLRKLVASVQKEINSSGLYWAIEEARIRCELAPHIPQIHRIFHPRGKRLERGDA